MIPISRRRVIPFWISLCALICTLAACDALLEDSELEKLNQALQTRLAELGGPEGLAAFTFPDRNNLSSIPQDPLNPLTQAKVTLGQYLFHETALGVRNLNARGRGTYSCASCHHTKAGFQAGVIQGIGEGGIGYGKNGEARRKHPRYDEALLDVEPIRTPATLSLNWQETLGWVGQYGADAGAPGLDQFGTLRAANASGFKALEVHALHSLSKYRLDVSGIAGDSTYKALYAQAFPEAPFLMNNTQTALALAAYQRTLLPDEAPFQRWLKGNHIAMSGAELRGALLFFGKAACHTCHTGPALNSDGFYALGMKDLAGFGVYGPQGASVPINKGLENVTRNTEDLFKFKTPQLYNLLDAPYYGHGASFQTVREVVQYKNKAVPENAGVDVGQLPAGFVPLNLSRSEVQDLTAFLETGLRDPNLRRFEPKTIPSGQCFPNNDTETRIDRGCK